MRRIVAIVLLTLALAASAEGVAPGQKALLLLRVLAYDRSLKARAGGEVRIAVVFRPGSPASERERAALLAALDEIVGRAVVAGFPVRAVAVPYRDPSDMTRRLAELAPAAMYVCDGLEDARKEMAKAAREAAALSFCGTRAGVVGGLGVGFVDRGERAALLVGLRAVKAQGADLDSALLSVAERVEPSE